MKKVLLATTSLVMTAGWAMADVTNKGSDVGASISLQGYASMGIIGTGDPDDLGGLDDDVISFASDIDLKFVMTGQTDGGLEFGAQVDLDETDGTRLWESPWTEGGETIYIRGAFGTLTMGDTDGAFDWAMTEAAFGDSIGDIQEHYGWNGNGGLDALYDGQVARYDYSFGDFSVGVSAELDDENDGDPILSIGGKYAGTFSGGQWSVGGGYQMVNDYRNYDVDAWLAGLSGTVTLDNGFMAILNYSTGEVDVKNGNDLDPEHYGIAIGYETGPLLVAANYGHFEEYIVGWDRFDTISDRPIFSRRDGNGYGFLANYDLGGGASLQGAVSNNDPDDGDDFVTYSFGVAMNF